MLLFLITMRHPSLFWGKRILYLPVELNRVRSFLIHAEICIYRNVKPGKHLCRCMEHFVDCPDVAARAPSHAAAAASPGRIINGPLSGYDYLAQSCYEKTPLATAINIRSHARISQPAHVSPTALITSTAFPQLFQIQLRFPITDTNCILEIREFYQ